MDHIFFDYPESTFRPRPEPMLRKGSNAATFVRLRTAMGPSEELNIDDLVSEMDCAQLTHLMDVILMQVRPLKSRSFLNGHVHYGPGGARIKTGLTQFPVGGSEDEPDDSLRKRIWNDLNERAVCPPPFSLDVSGERLDEAAARYGIKRHKGTQATVHVMMSDCIPPNAVVMLDPKDMDKAIMATLDRKAQVSTQSADECPCGGPHDPVGSGVPGGKTWCKKCDCDLT